MENKEDNIWWKILQKEAEKGILSDFNRQDTVNPKYGFLEIDFYGHSNSVNWNCDTNGNLESYTIQKHPTIPNHRLSMRKNLVTGKYELYRHFYEVAVCAISSDELILPDKQRVSEEILSESKEMKEVYEAAMSEFKKFHPECISN